MGSGGSTPRTGVFFLGFGVAFWVSLMAFWDTDWESESVSSLWRKKSLDNIRVPVCLYYIHLYSNRARVCIFLMNSGTVLSKSDEHWSGTYLPEPSSPAVTVVTFRRPYQDKAYGPRQPRARVSRLRWGEGSWNGTHFGGTKQVANVG